jgi:hypothetical protein
VKPDKKLIAAFDDMIKEADLIEKTGYTKDGLRKMRYKGVIKNWRSINGKKIMYSKTEIAQLLNLQIA